MATFAGELRDAATTERADWGGQWVAAYPKASRMHLALADWLDHMAGLVEDHGPGNQSAALALITARAINEGHH